MTEEQTSTQIDSNYLVNDIINGNNTIRALDARAIGIENSSVIDTHGGEDLIEGQGTALGVESAEAFGILNEGKINTGDDTDRVIGLASATGLSGNPVNGDAIALGYSEVDSNFQTGNLNTGSGNDEVKGTAIAKGKEDVGAFGLLLTDVDTNDDDDTLIGMATAEGIAATDARGISVGVSDIDDDTLFNPEHSSIRAEVGQLFTGPGNDVLKGTSHVVAVQADPNEDIFFAGSNGIVVDGPIEEQLFKLLAENPGASVEDILDQLDTSTLKTGAGQDRLIANVTLDVTGGLQAVQGGDPDLEVIADGIENAGTLDLGADDDFVSSTVTLTASGGAKGLADALDNSSVGIITGLGVEVNDFTLFDLGDGNDSFVSDISATVTGDLAAADGLGNRGVFKAGTGDDSFDLKANALFKRDNIGGDQEEGIADGWENRNDVFLGAGNDHVTANALARGNGILTIAEGIESRDLFDAGTGNDSFDLTATASSTADVLDENLTQAAGFQTEQIDSGELLLGDGNDSIIGRGTALGRNNTSTFGFGITQMTADLNNPDDPGLLDTSADIVTTDNDTLDGIGFAESKQDTAAFGLLFSNATTGIGRDILRGEATANSPIFADARGIAVGLGEDLLVKFNSLGQQSGLRAETGMLHTGDDDDSITGIATATTVSTGTLTRNDANGVIVDLNGTLKTGSGNDTVTGTATATDNGVGGADSAVIGDGIDNRGNFYTDIGDDVIIGTGEAHARNARAIAGGIDNGLGSSISGTPVSPVLNTASNEDYVKGSAIASAGEDTAIADGIENVGKIMTEAGNDVIKAEAFSEVTNGTATDESIADGIDNRGFLTTGDDRDKIDTDATAIADGSAFATANGIDNIGKIDLGAGNDVLNAFAESQSVDGDAEAIGILQDDHGEINLGAGDDILTAQAQAASINGNAVATGISGGTINAGSGNDQILATDSGFGDNVKINLQAGNDLLVGFGNATADGGAGFDTAQFDFDSDEIEVSIISGNSLILSKSDRENMTFTDVELFKFNDFSLSFNELTVV